MARRAFCRRCHRSQTGGLTERFYHASQGFCCFFVRSIFPLDTCARLAYIGFMRGTGKRTGAKGAASILPDVNAGPVPFNPSTEANVTLYDALREAGCKLDSHESDLYVEASAVATTILKRFPTQWENTRSFTSEIDGRLWFDVPFAFEPFWTRRIGARS